MPVKFLVPLNANNVKTDLLNVVTKGTLADVDVSGNANFNGNTNFSIIPTGPTASPNDSTTKLATTAYTQAALNALEAKIVNGAPAALDTLKEISDALLNGDAAAALVTNLALKAPLASPTFTGTVSGITATMVGLGNVTNTSDANKPISSATQTALNNINTVLALKAVKADVDASLELKADKTTVETSLSSKANTSTVATSLGLKADTSTVNSALALKATILEVTTETTRATGAESTLTTSVATERTRALGAEDILRQAIADEVTRSTAADTALTTRIDNLPSTGTDTALRADLNVEIARAEGVEALKAPLISPIFTGTLTAANPTFSGNLIAANPTFSGNLIAADAKINGTLTIKGLDSYGDYTFKSVLNGPDNLTDKLVLSKRSSGGLESVIMEMSQDEASAASLTDTITFSAPVVMNNTLKLSGLPTSGVGLSAGEIYVDNGFLKIKL
jgi:hypothetical protein